MSAIIWPIQTLYPAGLALNPAVSSVAGAAAIGGGSQVVASSQGVWMATLKGVNVNEVAQIKAAYALAARLEGMLNPVIVPMFGLGALLAPLPDGVTSIAPYDPIPHSDGSYFSDGSGYAPSPVTNITAAGSASAGAHSLNATVTAGGDIASGMHFSLGEGLTRRIYRVKTAIYTSATAVTLTFWPNLRHAVAAGDVLDFEKPECVMRLAADLGASLSLSAPHAGSMDIDFVEYF